MEKLKIAVIGSGLIATVKHLPALKNLRSQIETIALVDVNVEQGKTLASKFNIPKVYSDVGEMIEAEGPDIVDICTPPKTHFSIAKLCLEKGCHTLIEKPMAQTTEECAELIRLGKESGKKIMVAHSDLFYPSFWKARKAIESNRLGKLRGMRIHLSTPIDYITSKEDHWANKLPGGVFGESGPHVVYMSLPFVGNVQDVQVVGKKVLSEYPWSPYEDYRLELIGERCISSISMIYTTHDWAGQVEFWAEHGSIRIDIENQSFIQTKRSQLRAMPVALSTLGDATQIVTGLMKTGTDLVLRRYTQTHQVMLQQFAESIIHNRPVPVPPEEGLESIRVMNMITSKL